jgi:murein DD-endopeptidase MepM/ murein hydrolase activator NlpD/Tol biopolymer transport system component
MTLLIVMIITWGISRYPGRIIEIQFLSRLACLFLSPDEVPMNFRTYLFIAILSLAIVGATAPGLSNPRNLSTEQLNNSAPKKAEEMVGKTYQVGVDANGILLPGDIWPAPGDSPVSTGANVVLFKYFEERVGTDVYAVMAQIYDKGDPTKGELGTIVEDANHYGLSSISADGRFVAYSYKQPDIYNSYDVYLYDRDNPPAKKITVGANGAPANGSSTWPSISATGRYVAFYSQASNLVAGDNNGKADAFVYDRTTGKIALVSRNSSGEIADKGAGVPAISADGLHIVYESVSTNLDELVPNPPYALAFKTTINPADLSVQRTEWISIAPDGKNVLHISWNPAISRDGRYIAFSSNSAQIYVRDTVCQDTTLISLGLDGMPSTSAHGPKISADGRFVVFGSNDNDLVENDANKCPNNNTGRCPDVFIHDYLGDHSTQLISATPTGASGSGSSSMSVGFSPDGRNVYFESYATDLIEIQVPGHMVFLRRLPPVDPIPDRACPVKLAGRVTKRNGSPIPGVTVLAVPGQETLTQGDGTFDLTLTPGVYPVTLVTVAKDGYSFTPASQTVELTQDNVLGDFIGVADGGPVAPFLDLPFSYDGERDSFVRLLKNHSDGGQINAWFDHEYPWVHLNDGLRPYNSPNIIVDPLFVPEPSVGNLYYYDDDWWYSGHDAYDFSINDLSNRDAKAAGNGRVVSVGRACGIGICVVLDHENGYFTIYGHLASTNVQRDAWVNQGDKIGTIGNTGTVPIHLHFVVVRESASSPGWTGFKTKVVDPSGWDQAEPDPWVKDKDGPVSTYLWVHDVKEPNLLDGAIGGTVTDASQKIQIIVPANVLAGRLSATLFPATVGRIMMNLRTTGYSFGVELLNQDLPNLDSSLRFSEAQATPEMMTIVIDYSDSELTHLNSDLLTVYRQDGEGQGWLPLTTSVDTDQMLVTSKTDRLGTFSLQAPLLCPQDETEPDDEMFTASRIEVGSSYGRVFDTLMDEDWFSFEATQAQPYAIEATSLGADVDSVIEIYAGSGTILASSNDSRTDSSSALVWKAPEAGTYFIKVTPSTLSSVGCEANYALTVQEQAVSGYNIFMPSVIGGK